MAFVCHEYYKAFQCWAIFFHVPQYKGQLDNVGCIRCIIQRYGVVIWFLNSRNDFSEDLFTNYTDKIFPYCRWQIVYVSLVEIGLSFDMLCKKVAYWAMSSRIPIKSPFLGDPTNSLSHLNAKSCSAINLITLTTRYKTGLQYCSRRSSCCVSSVTFRPIAFNLLLKAIVAFNVPLTAHDYVDVLVNVSNHRSQ